MNADRGFALASFVALLDHAGLSSCHPATVDADVSRAIPLEELADPKLGADEFSWLAPANPNSLALLEHLDPSEWTLFGYRISFGCEARVTVKIVDPRHLRAGAAVATEEWENEGAWGITDLSVARGSTGLVVAVREIGQRWEYCIAAATIDEALVLSRGLVPTWSQPSEFTLESGWQQTYSGARRDSVFRSRWSTRMTIDRWSWNGQGTAEVAESRMYPYASIKITADWSRVYGLQPADWPEPVWLLTISLAADAEPGEDRRR